MTVWSLLYSHQLCPSENWNSVKSRSICERLHHSCPCLYLSCVVSFTVLWLLGKRADAFFLSLGKPVCVKCHVKLDGEKKKGHELNNRSIRGGSHVTWFFPAPQPMTNRRILFGKFWRRKNQNSLAQFWPAKVSLRLALHQILKKPNVGPRVGWGRVGSLRSLSP